MWAQEPTFHVYLLVLSLLPQLRLLHPGPTRAQTTSRDAPPSRPRPRPTTPHGWPRLASGLALSLAPPCRTWASGAAGAAPRRACSFRTITCRFHSGMGRPRSSRVGTSPSRSPKRIPSSCSATRLPEAPPATVSAPCVDAGRSFEAACRRLPPRNERRGGPARRSTAAGGGAWGLPREDGRADHYCTPSLFKCEASEHRGPPSLCDPVMCGKARMLRDSPHSVHGRKEVAPSMPCGWGNSSGEQLHRQSLVASRRLQDLSEPLMCCVRSDCTCQPGTEQLSGWELPAEWESMGGEGQQGAPGPAFPWTDAFLYSDGSICQGEGLDPLGPPGIEDGGISTLMGGHLLVALISHLSRSWVCPPHQAHPSSQGPPGLHLEREGSAWLPPE